MSSVACFLSQLLLFFSCFCFGISGVSSILSRSLIARGLEWVLSTETSATLECFNRKLTNPPRPAKAKASVPVQIKSERTWKKKDDICYLKSYIYIYIYFILFYFFHEEVRPHHKDRQCHFGEGQFSIFDGCGVISFQGGKHRFSTDYSIIAWKVSWRLQRQFKYLFIYGCIHFSFTFFTDLFVCFVIQLTRANYFNTLVFKGYFYIYNGFLL